MDTMAVIPIVCPGRSNRLGAWSGKAGSCRHFPVPSGQGSDKRDL